jgi:phospholipid/cholesterol/gamma-HCH transport system substrate-binding protein
MRKLTNELKTGIVIVVAILIGLFLWLKTSDFAVQSYRLKTHFTNAAGIKENAVVTLAGVEAGRVESLNFTYEPATKVELVLLLDKKAKVRSDSIAYISSAGFIGDAFVDITPGASNKFLKNNAILISEEPIEMRELMKRADKIAENLDVILADVRGVVSDNKGKIDSIVVNLEQTAVNFNEFSEDIKRHPWKLLMKGKEKKKRRR